MVIDSNLDRISHRFRDMTSFLLKTHIFLTPLSDEVPAHKALHSCVRLSQGRLPDPTWKRRPGRPRGRWIDQL